MAMAKVFQNGRSQAIRLPKEFRFDEDEVCIKKVGYTVMIYPKAKEKEIFLSSLGKLSEDFYESVAEQRAAQAAEQPRDITL